MDVIVFILIAIVCLAIFLLWQGKVKSRMSICEDNIQKLLSIKDSFGNIKRCASLKDKIGFLNNGQHIRPFEMDAIRAELKSMADEAESVRKSMREVALKSEIIDSFLYDVRDLEKIIVDHNEACRIRALDENKDFFDSVLKYPLDAQQRYSIASEAENCLVVSSAGSGKTSSIVGKVRYLIDKKSVPPSKILLISYTNKAASELTERMNIKGLRGYTFHKLAIDIIGKITSHKPSICEDSSALLKEVYKKLLNDNKFQQSVVDYFGKYEIEQEDWEIRKQERQQALSEVKAKGYKALFPDMDGKEIVVRSEQEKQICFALSSLGVKFRYEESYEIPVEDAEHSQYRPDFSIYSEEGKRKRVYLEHFGINEKGNVPAWFAEQRGISYDEANRRYGNGIVWKRELHQQNGTVMLETTSADFSKGDIKETLKKLLLGAGVPIKELTPAELYELILPKDSKKEKSFISLVASFATLLKTNCLKIDDVLRKAQQEKDERGVFVIQNIFAPVIGGYNSALKERNEKDFTDIILEATDLIRPRSGSFYEYIIVDEFQDISIDRYRFLQQLRKGNPQARLYCVGDDWQSIYRFSGSDMALFNSFEEYFGATEVDRIETTYRFGNPLIGISSNFVQRNPAQLKKNVRPFSNEAHTELFFLAYDRKQFTTSLKNLLAQIPREKRVYLLGRYSFDDYYISLDPEFKQVKRGNHFFYVYDGRELEFLTVHKSKGLEADIVILLQCNKDIFGFPSLMSDDPVLRYVLSKSDDYPFGEERRLFYVAITRAKEKTYVMYDRRFPSVFVDEFLHPQKEVVYQQPLHKNANKRWGYKGDEYLKKLWREGKDIKQISSLMGRSQTAIRMRLEKLGELH